MPALTAIKLLIHSHTMTPFDAPGKQAFLLYPVFSNVGRFGHGRFGQDVLATDVLATYSEKMDVLAKTILYVLFI